MTKEISPVRVPERGLTIQEELQIHRMKRMESGKTWADYWGANPVEALANLPLKHTSKMSPSERSNLYFKLART